MPLQFSRRSSGGVRRTCPSGYQAARRGEERAYTQPLDDNALDLRAQNVFREHPFQEFPDYAQMLKAMLDRKEFQEFINFN